MDSTKKEHFNRRKLRSRLNKKLSKQTSPHFLKLNEEAWTNLLDMLTSKDDDSHKLAIEMIFRSNLDISQRNCIVKFHWKIMHGR